MPPRLFSSIAEQAGAAVALDGGGSGESETQKPLISSSRNSAPDIVTDVVIRGPATNSGAVSSMAAPAVVASSVAFECLPGTLGAPTPGLPIPLLATPGETPASRRDRGLPTPGGLTVQPPGTTPLIHGSIDIANVIIAPATAVAASPTPMVTPVVRRGPSTELQERIDSAMRV